MLARTRILRSAIGTAALIATSSLSAQTNPSEGYPPTYLGCLAAAADQLIDCVDMDVYPDWMCVETYDIVVGLCRVQFPE